MAGMYESGQPMKIADLGDTIFIAEATQTPFGALIPRGPRPTQMLNEWPVQQYPKRGFGGTMDGHDIDEFSHTDRDKLSAYGMWLMSDGWMVSRLAAVTRAAGVQRNERGKQAADDALLFAQQMERQMLSAVDTQAEAAPATPYRSRGVFSWLDTDAQGVLPVDSKYRPGSDSNYAGTLANFTPAQFETMLEQAATEKKSPVDLLGLVALKLKSRMSKWAQKSDDEDSKTDIRSMVQEASSKKLIHQVDVFEFDAGRVRNMISWHLRCDEADGSNSDYTLRSGVWVDQKMWQMRFLDPVASYVMPPNSGGPRGYHDAIYILRCMNPLGQLMAEISS